MDNNLSKNMKNAFYTATAKATEIKSELITPELLLNALLQQKAFAGVIKAYCSEFGRARRELALFISTHVETGKDRVEEKPLSFQMNEALQNAGTIVKESNAKEIDIPHIIYGIYRLNDSYAAYWLKKYVNLPSSELICALTDCYSGEDKERKEQDKTETAIWQKYCRPLEPEKDWNLIGRKREMARMMLVLCRKRKSNPLLVGEHGVGKTAIVYGLARALHEKGVPERLRGKQLFTVDFAGILSGTQFRGQFEERMKDVLDGVASMNDAILFIDNIHEVIGAGRTSESVIDASSMMLPYMEERKISFIGATTYEEYKKSVQRNRNLGRLFQKVEIDEPGRDDSVEILEGLRPQLEAFHGVRYADDVVGYVVDSTERYIHDRKLPEKALDLMDEAGAYRELNPLKKGPQIVDRALINETLSKICNIDLTEKKEDEDAVFTLKQELLKRIYGQDAAIETVCDAVYTAKAGLSDALKPMASFLFVGPTGVGKTQLAKDLADLLMIPLQRFDMSEYTEKHTVSKFIGAPAGYVGYEDGGLLVDTIKRTPHCVLLLDEIEKAHQDIYNLLLQIMDYGTLSDSHGQKADFRNAIIIMTSNAGARFASKATIGFIPSVDAGKVMNKEVKNVFAPEFINRLSATVVFNNLTEEMARLIVNAKIAILDTNLKSRNISLSYTSAAKEEILKRGYSPEYGAREIERVISREIKPLVVKEILFGFLKCGGDAVMDLVNDNFSLKRL